MMAWVQIFTLVMQFVVLIVIVRSAWLATRSMKLNDQTLNAIREYRREIHWLTARIEALEVKAGRMSVK